MVKKREYYGNPNNQNPHLACLLAIGCLGFNKDSEKLQLFLTTEAARQFSQTPDNYGNSSKEAIYSFSDNEITSIVELEKQLTDLKLNEPDIIENSVNGMPEAFYFVRKTDKQIEADVLDWDLGLPPEDRSLNSDQKAQIKKDRLREVDEFFQNMKKQISKADNESLKNIRINTTLAIAAYNKMKDKLKANLEIDQEFVDQNMREHVRVRELAIDEMVKRGLPL